MIGWFGLALPLAIAYAVTAKWIWDVWWLPDSYYSHGPLVPLLAVILLVARRQHWSAVPAAPAAAGWWLLGAGLLVHAAGAALTIDSLSALSLWLSVPGACWLVLGGARLRRLLPILGLIVFATPMPLFVSGRLAFELKELAVGAGLALAQALGFGGEQAGGMIRVPGQTETLEVADPCSGLRSLVALTTLGYCIAFFAGPIRLRRVLLLLALAVPVALGVNMLRIAAICLLAERTSVPFAAGTGHDVLNVGAWVLALAVLLGFDFWLGRRRT